MATKKSPLNYNVPKLNPNVQLAENVPDELFVIPLDGQWTPSINPAVIGKNFQTMTNMRYAEGHPESILGMTKINTTSLNPSTLRTIKRGGLTAIDLTGVNTLTFWIYASRTGSNITLSILDSGGTITSKTPNVTVANTLQEVTWDISGVTDANKNDITTITVTIDDYTEANTFYLDSLKNGATVVEAFGGSGETDATMQAKWIVSNSDNLQVYNSTTIYATGSSGSMKVVDKGAVNKIQQMFYFSRNLHPESHLLVQTYNSDKTYSCVMENITVIPSQGNFVGTPLWEDSSGAGVGRFSNSPNGQLCYCNGIDTCIWAGDETPISAVMTISSKLVDSSSALSNPKDVTELLSNTNTSAEETIRLGGGVDTSTSVLLHFDGANGTYAPIDYSDNAGVVTRVGEAVLSTAAKKFGISSGLFDGTNDGFDIAEIDFFGADNFTIDYWRSYGTGVKGVCGQYTSASVYWFLKEEVTVIDFGFGEFLTTVVQFKVVNTAVLADYSWYSFLGRNDSTFHHIEISRSGTSLKCFVNGSEAYAYPPAQAIGTNAVHVQDTKKLSIGYCHSTVFGGGYIDEFRISKVARHTAPFTPPVAPYASAQYTILYGATRPISGVSPYILTPNLITSTIAVETFDGSSFSSVKNMVDGTTTDGVAFAKTGDITWDSTVGTSRQKYLDGYYLYWYQITLSGGSAVLYHSTMSVPFQPLKDVWDGNFREIGTAYGKLGAVEADVTLNIKDYEAYIPADTTSFFSMASFATTDYLDLGFTQKQAGLFLAIPTDYFNDTASVMTISYWDGSAFSSVGVCTDGTLDSGGTKTLAKTGIISWDNASILSETKKSLHGGFPLYYYRITVSQTLDGSTRVYYVGGVPTPSRISGYNFSIHAADRLMLGCDNYQYKNALQVSAQDRPEVHNGQDSQGITFGSDSKLTCAESIYAQYSSNIYNIILVFKADETWILQWNQSTTGVSWSRFCISPNVGCPAPGTLKSASVIFENNINQSKFVAIWRASDGIYLSNGQSPFCISKDISSVFDQSSTVHINNAMAEYENSFIDRQNHEYHWCWASGSNTVLDKEYVLDLVKWKWYEIDRTAGKRLQGGIGLVDTYGTNYNYGFIDGYVERLEYGTAFDGNDMVSTLHFGNQLLTDKNPSIMSSISRINLVCEPKNTESTLTMTHYLDGAASGSDYTLSMADSTHSIANVMSDVYSSPAVFHGLKFVTTGHHETKGFEPLYLTATYQKVREHTR